MRKLYFLVTVFLFLFPVMGHAGSDHDPFELKGYWINSDPDTKGITSLFIYEDREIGFVINIYGKCFPIDCEWNPILVHNLNNPFFAIYESDIKIVILKFNMDSKDTLYLNTTHLFKNDPERNYEANYSMYRDTLIQ